MYSLFEASVEKWAAGKYCFCAGAKRESTKQAGEEVAHVSAAATHTYSKEEAHCQSPYLSLLSIPSFP